MIDFESLKLESRGRWASIYHQLGIGVGEGKHQPCPFCGGEDRFRFDDRNSDGDYFCNQCGAGDGFCLVMKCLGIDFKEAIKRIQSIVGRCEKMETKDSPDPKPALNKLWNSSKLLTGSDPVSLYLHSRGLTLKPDNVRFCAECYHKESGKKLPALIARIQNASGNPINLHRIYLQDVKPKKMLMPGTEPINGGAIRLFQPDDKLFHSGILGIGEGIETCLATSQLFGVATWSCINSTLMESWEPPERIREIVVFADRDATFTGEAAAYKLAKRLYQKDLLVRVETPEEIGDFNDVLKGVK